MALSSAPSLGINPNTVRALVGSLTLMACPPVEKMNSASSPIAQTPEVKQNTPSKLVDIKDTQTPDLNPEKIKSVRGLEERPLTRAEKVRAVIDLALREDCGVIQEPSRQYDFKIAFEYGMDQYTLEPSVTKGDDPASLLISHQKYRDTPRVRLMIDRGLDGIVDIGAVMNASSEEEKRFYAIGGENIEAMLPKNRPYWQVEYDNAIDAARAYLSKKCPKKD